MTKTDYQFYITGATKLGIGFGVVSLLARWVTGNTILSSPETLMKYGLVGGIGYSLMGAVALILFGFLAKEISERYPDKQTIGDVLRLKLNASGFWYMTTVLLFTSFDSLFVQAMGAGILLHLIFPIPIFFGMLLFLLFCFFVGGVGGIQRLHQLAGINVALIFGAVIIIPVYFFIQEGVYPVFEGIKLYHPYLLYFHNYDAIWFTFTAILIGFGQVLIDRATWQRVFIIKKEKIRMTFTLTGIIWATVPLALSTMVMIAIFGRGYENIYSLLVHLIDKINSTMLIILFVLFFLSAISSTISSELHATTTLIVKNILQLFYPLTNPEKWRWTYLISGTICLVLLGVVTILSPSLLELLFFFGNIYASVIVPMLYIILSRKKLPWIIPYSSLVGCVGGYLTLPFLGEIYGVWVSFMISSCICVIYSALKFLAHK